MPTGNDNHSVLPLRFRLGVAALVTAGALAICSIGSQSEGFRTDFDQGWHAARAVLEGRNPHDYVGPERRFDYGVPLYYPMPAVVASLPFAVLPLWAARLAFVGSSTFLLTFGLCRNGLGRLPILLSGAFIMALGTGQWEILLTAALLIPAAAAIAAAKPNIGLALAFASASRRFLAAAITGGIFLAGVSFALWPGWLADWLEKIRMYPEIPLLVTHWGGLFVLLALLRWRRAEARLLVALVLVPHTTLAYASLPVMLVARRAWESAALALLSLGVLVAQLSIDPRGRVTEIAPIDVFAGFASDAGQLMVLATYIPATLLVLRRSNEYSTL